MARSPLLELLRYGALSLMLSVVLVAAGERWPQPLPPNPLWALALVVLPPAVVLLWLALHWSLPAQGTGDGGESQQSKASEL
jgi:hypothetical protein